METDDQDNSSEEGRVRPGSARGAKRPRPSTARGRVWRLFVYVLSAYVGVCVLISLFQSKLVYYPSRGYDRTPMDVGLAYEDLTLQTSDGLSIAAWYVPNPAAKGSVIFCHGNAGNIADRLDSVKRLYRMGLSVLIFDYRGFGRSEGKPNEQGTYEDVETAWRHLVDWRGELPERVVLFGRSLGGGVAIELARRHTPAALVVESTFTNLVDVGRANFPFLPVRLLLTYRYDSIEKVPHITCPKLFLHGRDDRLIPLRIGKRLFEAAAEPKQFIETPGGHNEAGFTYSPEFTDRVAIFIDEILSPS